MSMVVINLYKIERYSKQCSSKQTSSQIKLNKKEQKYNIFDQQVHVFCGSFFFFCKEVLF